MVILLLPPAADAFWLCLRVLAARATRRFFDGPFGFLTEGIAALWVWPWLLVVMGGWCGEGLEFSSVILSGLGGVVGVKL